MLRAKPGDDEWARLNNRVATALFQLTELAVGALRAAGFEVALRERAPFVERGRGGALAVARTLGPQTVGIELSKSAAPQLGWLTAALARVRALLCSAPALLLGAARAN